MYSQKVMEHFMNPKNVGEIPDADGIGIEGNPVCGDMMYLFIKVKDDRIEDIKFKTFGCAAAIAVSSILTEMVKGKTLQEALSLTKEDILREIGGLPSQKVHCSVLGIEALRKAIDDFKAKKGAK